MNYILKNLLILFCCYASCYAADQKEPESATQKTDEELQLINYIHRQNMLIESLRQEVAINKYTIRQLAKNNEATAITASTICTMLIDFSGRIDALEQQNVSKWQALVSVASESSSNSLSAEPSKFSRIYQGILLSDESSQSDTGYASSADELDSIISQNSRKRLREIAVSLDNTSDNTSRPVVKLSRQRALIGDELLEAMGGDSTASQSKNKRQRKKK